MCPLQLITSEFGCSTWSPSSPYASGNPHPLVCQLCTRHWFNEEISKQLWWTGWLLFAKPVQQDFQKTLHLLQFATNIAEKLTTDTARTLHQSGTWCPWLEPGGLWFSVQFDFSFDTRSEEVPSFKDVNYDTMIPLFDRCGHSIHTHTQPLVIHNSRSAHGCGFPTHSPCFTRVYGITSLQPTSQKWSWSLLPIVKG